MLLVLLRIAATTLSKRGPTGTPRESVKDGNGIGCFYFVFLIFLIFFTTQPCITQNVLQLNQVCKRMNIVAMNISYTPVKQLHTLSNKHGLNVYAHCSSQRKLLL